MCLPPPPLIAQEEKRKLREAELRRQAIAEQAEQQRAAASRGDVEEVVPASHSLLLPSAVSAAKNKIAGRSIRF